MPAETAATPTIQSVFQAADHTSLLTRTPSVNPGVSKLWPNQ